MRKLRNWFGDGTDAAGDDLPGEVWRGSGGGVDRVRVGIFGVRAGEFCAGLAEGRRRLRADRTSGRGRDGNGVPVHRDRNTVCATGGDLYGCDVDDRGAQPIQDGRNRQLPFLRAGGTIYGADHRAADFGNANVSGRDFAVGRFFVGIGNDISAFGLTLGGNLSVAGNATITGTLSTANFNPGAFTPSTLSVGGNETVQGSRPRVDVTGVRREGRRNDG